MQVTRWVVTGLVVVMLACLGGRGCLSFVRFGAKSRTSEAKVALRELYVAQLAFAADAGRWAQTVEELGLTSRRGNRYRLALAADPLVLVPGRGDGGMHGALGVDDERFFGPATALHPDSQQPSSDAAHAAAIPARVWSGSAGEFHAAATGNVDLDPLLDVWSISSEPRECLGRWVDAGVPCHEVDDVNGD